MKRKKTFVSTKKRLKVSVYIFLQIIQPNTTDENRMNADLNSNDRTSTNICRN